MKLELISAVLVLTALFGAKTVHAQGATQAVRNAAQAAQETVQQSQSPLTAGPADREERMAPGKMDSNPPREFTATPSGLKYRILRKGGGKKPKPTDTVEVNYKGWLDNQTIFDSSYRRGKPLTFPLNRVIKGWTEGMQLIGEGGMIELSIPYQLGYGERPAPGGRIPPKSQLHYIFELISVK